jgi:7-cyano-7-deazaguanine synthase
MDNTKALVVFSGGQDSTTCLYYAKQTYEHVTALTFDYGQTHAREIEAAVAVASRARVPHVIVSVPKILLSSSPLLQGGLKTLSRYDNYDSMVKEVGETVEKTFVPFRNPFFLLLAANRAVAYNCAHIVTGVCGSDSANYPDCRASFVESMNAMLLQAYGKADFPKVDAPLLHMNKKKIVELAITLPGCYAALAHSHTSYANDYPPLDKNHASLLRAKGFADAGIPDPLVLRAFKEGLLRLLPAESNYANCESYLSMI